MSSPFGLVNINKPEGLTSRQVVDRVVQWAGTRKVGHAGTLDPMATGVLVVCIGRATRLIPFVQQQRKVYRATVELGKTSTTDDRLGEIVQTEPPPTPVPLGRILQELRAFAGRIQQVPPKFSAVHVAGRRAYELARAGKAVPLPPREVEVYRIDVLTYEFPRLVLEIECGTGTYIRAIARDLGQRLGCGGLLADLQRTRIGPFTLENAISLDELNGRPIQECLLSPLLAVEHLPKFVCTEEDLRHVRVGRPVPFDPARLLNGQSHTVDERRPDAGGTLSHRAQVALLAPDKQQLLGVAEFRADSQLLAPHHVFYHA